MKKIARASLLILALSVALLSACGGGGGGGSVTTTHQPTTAVLTLNTTLKGTIPPSDTTLNGYKVVITLPDGVTVKTWLNSAETGTDVVKTYGSASFDLILGVYTAATSTLPGTVTIEAGSAAGYNPGDFCKVTFDITPGHNPKASDFQQPTFAANGYLHTHLGFPDDLLTDIDLTGQLTLSASAVIN